MTLQHALDIRPERPADATAIDALTRLAFAGQPFSQQTEHLIVRGLREAGALTLSLVAATADEVIGHVAFSPVTIAGADIGWWGLGPVSVAPAQQRRGIGSALIRQGLRQAAERGVAGCVVLGDPHYYGRFGFMHSASLRYPGPPAEHFMALALHAPMPAGQVSFHLAFDVEAP